MSGTVRRFLRISLFSLLLIPVCVVLAGDTENSWRVRMPVAQTLSGWVSKRDKSSLIYVADLKRPVSAVTLSSTPFESISVSVESVAEESNSTYFGAEGVNHNAAQIPSMPEANTSLVGGGTETAVFQEGSSEKYIAENKVDDPVQAEIEAQDDRLILPSVSLVPSDNTEEKQRRGAEYGSFFTTPKRFAGLTGTLIRMEPSLSLRETYDSNVDYKEIEDFIAEITPALKCEIIGEEGRALLRGEFQYRDYLRYNELDRYDYSVELTGTQNFTPRVKGKLALSHRRYHNLDQNTYESGGVDLDPTIILKTTATPEINWMVTERDNLIIANYLEKTDYERKTDADYISNVLSFVWGHTLQNELITLYFGEMNTFTHFSREIDDLNGDQVSFQGIVGIDHQFSPAWRLSLKGGPGLTFSNYSSDTGKDEAVDFLYQFRAELGYERLEYRIVPALERVVRPGRYGENEVLDQAELFFKYEFTENFACDAISTYWMTESEGVNGGDKYKSSGFFLQSVVSWIFRKNWNGFAGASYNGGRNEITGSTNERFKTWVGIKYSFPTEIN